MQNKVKNSETPYFSTSPVQDQFGQLIVAFGITKREKLAMELFLKSKIFHGIVEIEKDILFEIISECYKQADLFLNFFEEGQKENSSKIIL
jgi:hypothetical protein